MRVLHVVPTYLPATRYGGPIQSVHGLCTALVRRGHDIEVFTTPVDGTVDSAVPLCRPVDLDGVNVWYFPSQRMRRLYWSPRMAQALRGAVTTFDLVHLHSVFLWPTWAAARAARRAQVPFIVSPRGMLVRDLIRGKSRWVKSAWIALIERRTLETAAGVHLTAALELDELHSFGFRLPPARVIANGIEPSLAPPFGAVSIDVSAALQGGPYVLYLGRLSWKKSLDKLIRAAGSVPRVRLVIAGNDDEHHEPRIRSWIAEAGIESRATVLPRFIEGADKAALLGGAAVFALPSVSENFGIVALEAMAAGCPVLVSNGVGLAAAIAEAKAGIVASPDQFPVVLGRLMDDPELRMTLARNARQLASTRYGWPAIAAEMESFYASLLPGCGQTTNGAV
jgi:glycosyltransferase involved in cell wall biosynthesis